MAITGPRTITTHKPLGITVDTIEDNLTLDKAIQCPQDLWDCPALATLVPVLLPVQDKQEKPLVAETEVVHTTEVGVQPTQHIEENFWTQGIDEVLIEKTIIKDKTREPEVNIGMFCFKSEIKLMDTVEICCQF